MSYIINAIEDIVNYMKGEGGGIATGTVIAGLTAGVLLSCILLLVF